MTSRPLPREPLVSIVTPCLNAVPYIEETLRSVLTQDYPRIEYLVMDGGSTDGTLAILNQYSARLQYLSSPDGGQADAVNRGFAKTRGEVLAFLNADDVYTAGAVMAAVQGFADHPDAAVVYGEALYMTGEGEPLSPYPVEPFDRENLARRCFISQPAAFFRRDAFDAVGALDATLRYALDYDLWIRMARGFNMVKIDRRLAMMRLHDDTKTISQMGSAMRETLEVLRRHYKYVPHNWLYGYGHHRLTGRSVAIDKPGAAFTSACLSIALGARYNWRHPLRYCLDIITTARHGLA